MEPFLRQHGVPCKLNKGVIELLGDHTICAEGAEISAAAAALLKVFDYKLATFRIVLDSVWENGEFEVLNERPDGQVVPALEGAFDFEDDDGDFKIEEREVPSDGEEAAGAAAGAVGAARGGKAGKAAAGRGRKK